MSIPDPARNPGRRPWVSPRLEELGRFAELTRLQVTAECRVSASDSGCSFGGFSAPSSVPEGAIDLRGGR